MSMEQNDTDNGKMLSWITGHDGFMPRHGLLWAEILFCIILYICNRYAYQREQVTAERLRRELVNMEYQTLNVTSDVSAKSKPSYIEKVVDKEGSGLIISGESPYRLP